MKPERRDDEPMIPVSPSTGLDPEVRQFMSRVMVGYEAAHRTIADMAELMAKSASESQAATVRAIQLQMQLAEEREELLSKRHKRDLEAKNALALQESRKELMREGTVAVKLALKKFLGVPLTGNDSHGLQDLLASLSGEQIDGLMTTGSVTLSDAQRQALMMTLTSLAESEKKNDSPALPAGEPASDNGRLQ
jgi:N-acyl-D-aspartate/D-glutamate deacylase